VDITTSRECDLGGSGRVLHVNLDPLGVVEPSYLEGEQAAGTDR